MSQNKYLDLAGLTAYDRMLKEWFKSGVVDITDDAIRALFVTVAECPADNEIWYYTDDNNVVNLQGMFGDMSDSITNAKLVSNTYKNGKGILQFDSDVTSINSVYGGGRQVSGFHDSEGGSPNLTKLILPKTVVRLEDYAFLNECKLECIEVNLNSIQYIGNSCFTGTNLAEFILPILPTQFDEIGNGWFEGNGCLSLIIPDHINSIGGSAFANCSSLETVDLSNVSSIGGSAFANCRSLKTIDASNVTNIGESAFIECVSLETINTSNVTNIGESAFDFCKKLKSVNLSNISSISRRTFYYCEELETITIPISVTSIDEEAFSGCDKLVSIIYEGTIEQWNSVHKYRTENSDWLGGWGSYMEPWHETSVPATHVQCTDGQVPIDKSQIQ